MLYKITHTSFKCHWPQKERTLCMYSRVSAILSSSLLYIRSCPVRWVELLGFIDFFFVERMYAHMSCNSFCVYVCVCVCNMHLTSEAIRMHNSLCNNGVLACIESNLHATALCIIAICYRVVMHYIIILIRDERTYQIIITIFKKNSHAHTYTAHC